MKLVQLWLHFGFPIMLGAGFLYCVLYVYLEKKEYSEAKVAHIIGYACLCIHVAAVIPPLLALLPVILLIVGAVEGVTHLRYRFRPPAPTPIKRLVVPDMMPLWPAPASEQTCGRVAISETQEGVAASPAREVTPLFRTLRTSVE